MRIGIFFIPYSSNPDANARPPFILGLRFAYPIRLVSEHYTRKIAFIISEKTTHLPSIAAFTICKIPTLITLTAGNRSRPIPRPPPEMRVRILNHRWVLRTMVIGVERFYMVRAVPFRSTALRGCEGGRRFFGRCRGE